jgi:hypothetical protein
MLMTMALLLLLLSTSSASATLTTSIVKKLILRNTDCGDCVVRLADTPNVEPEELPSVVLEKRT